jgi:HSP20 family protein
MYSLLKLLNYWNRYVEGWFNESSMVFVDDEFEIMEQELVKGFDKLTEEFDKTFDDDLDELDFSELYLGVRSETVKEVDVILYGFSPVNPKPNKDTKVRKIRKNFKPASLQRRNPTDYDNITGSTIPLSRIEKMDQDSSEDVIATDKNIKIVLQLPINNRRENIKVFAHSDNSVTITHLNSAGKRCTRTSVIPYDNNFETAKATYKNGILEVTFNRK